MAQIRFYRGAAEDSLPNYQNGAVFVVSNTNFDDGYYLGDIYVDVDNGRRLKIKPNNAVYYKTKEQWNQTTTISKTGEIYVVSDYEPYQRDNTTNTVISYLPGIRVGDGTSYIKDLPILKAAITSEEQSFWNNKVTAYATQIDSTDYKLCLSALGVNPNVISF